MSGFSGDIFNSLGGSGGGGGGPNLSGRSMVIPGAGSMAVGNPNGSVVLPFGFQQQQQQMAGNKMLQQQQQLMLQEQIAQRRGNLLVGKRSFGDFYQQQLLQQQQMHLFGQQPQQLVAQHQHHHQQQNQQQQQQQLLSYLQQRPQLMQQQPQQQMSSASSLSSFLQQQYLMRSVKPRINVGDNNNNINMIDSSNNSKINVIDSFSPTHSNNSNNISSVTRFGVPVYQQQQKIIPPSNNHLTNNSVVSNPIPQGTGFSGYSNPAPKAWNTLEELEKELLADDDDCIELDCGDAVSGVTNSEWSEAFQTLINPAPCPNPNPNQSSSPVAQVSTTTSCINNNNNDNGNGHTSSNDRCPNNCNNNMFSPSPTSSTSSSCSTSASATATPTTTLVTVTATTKELITEAATAISEGKAEAAAEAITKLGSLGKCKGNSEQRLAYYMGNALKCRACPDENPPPVEELFGKDQMGASYSLYDVSPCFKFGLLAANLVMLDAIISSMHDNLRVHVVDFDVGHGGQYINLLRALAERREPPLQGRGVQLRITVVRTETVSAGVAGNVREGLVKLAERVGIKLSFVELTRSIHELTRASLGCEEGEAVVVNFAFKLYRVPDESVSMDNLRDELLRRVKGLSPRVVTLVEQDMNGNTAPFLTRVNEVCGYYAALFDSLEATLPRDNPDRCRVEEGLGLRMANSVACEGRERVERAEVFGKWRARMGMSGFELKPLGGNLAESMRAKLSSGRGGNPGFTVKEENGGLGFGWMGRTLAFASKWC